MPGGAYPLTSLGPDLLGMAAGLRALAEADAQALLGEEVVDAVRKSNAEIWRTKGAAIGARWGSYRTKRDHPLPKDPGSTYWLIDLDYYDGQHLRSSLADVGRHPRSRLVYRGMDLVWWSTLSYAPHVNRRYGRIYGVTPRGRKAILDAVRNYASEIADLGVRGTGGAQ